MFMKLNAGIHPSLTSTLSCGSPKKLPQASVATRYGMHLTPGEVGKVGSSVQKHVAPVVGSALGVPLGFVSSYFSVALIACSPLGFIFNLPFALLGSLAAGPIAGGMLGFKNKPLRRFFSAPFTYFDWRAMKHYVRTGQKVPLFMPQNAVKQYRAVTYHAPTAGAVTGGFLGFKLGTPWARRAASEGEQMARHAGTTLAGGALGYTTGHGIKAMLLQHLKSLKFLR
jgi:hypothetical protein